MTDPVREYLSHHGYADFVVEGGLRYLLHSWELTVESVVRGETQYQDDYLNDMDGRRALEEALSAAPEKERQIVAGRVAQLDACLRVHLVPTSECIWGAENAQKCGYQRERDWWYFHRPRNVDESWRDY